MIKRQLRSEDFGSYRLVKMVVKIGEATFKQHKVLRLRIRHYLLFTPLNMWMCM